MKHVRSGPGPCWANMERSYNSLYNYTHVPVSLLCNIVQHHSTVKAINHSELINIPSHGLAAFQQAVGNVKKSFKDRSSYNKQSRT